MRIQTLLTLHLPPLLLASSFLEQPETEIPIPPPHPHELTHPPPTLLEEPHISPEFKWNFVSYPHSPLPIIHPPPTLSTLTSPQDPTITLMPDRSTPFGAFEQSLLQQPPSPRRLSSSSTPYHYDRYRVHFDYSLFPSSSLSPRLQDILNTSQSWLSKVVRTIPSSSLLRLDRTCIQKYTGTNKCKLTVSNETCFGNPIPSTYLSSLSLCPSSADSCQDLPAGAGVPADILILLTFTDDYCSSSTIGWATNCRRDQYDKPLAGILNVCKSNWGSNTMSFDSVTTFIIHEILHSMGVSLDDFAFFRDENRLPRTGRDSSTLLPPWDSSTGRYAPSGVTTVLSRPDTIFGRDLKFLMTPKVRSVVRNHFGCDNLEGAALEDEGSASTQFSHLDKKVFGNEGMTGQLSDRAMFSPVTLGILDDSGWYVANFDEVPDLSWGRDEDAFSSSSRRRLEGEERRLTGENKGCVMASLDTPCISSSQSVDSKHYCTQSTSYNTCSQDRYGGGRCGIYNYSADLPVAFRYFSSPRQGGLMYANFCPVVNVHNVSGESYDSSCSNLSQVEEKKSQSASSAYGETFGERSRCVESAVMEKNLVYQERSGAGRCYPMKCLVDAGESRERSNLAFVGVEMTLTARSAGGERVETVTCYAGEEGVRKSVSGNFNGYVTCPAVRSVCGGFPCQYGGMWRENRCVCRPGYEGAYCERFDNGERRDYYLGGFYFEKRDGFMEIGKFYKVGSSLSGPSVSFYSAVTPLPAGLKVDKMTGAIYGTPEVATGACLAYTIAAVRKVDGKQVDQARTVVFLRVYGQGMGEEAGSYAESRVQCSNEFGTMEESAYWQGREGEKNLPEEVPYDLVAHSSAVKIVNQGQYPSSVAPITFYPVIPTASSVVVVREDTPAPDTPPGPSPKPDTNSASHFSNFTLTFTVFAIIATYFLHSYEL